MTTQRRRLVLLTTNYPFTHTGGETMFVAPELPHLARAFSADGQPVCVVPLHDTGRQLPVPQGVVVDRSLAQRWRATRLACNLRAPAWPGFWPELWRGLVRGGPVGVVRVWRWAAVAQAVWQWMQTSLEPGAPVILYTYWRGGATLAAVRWSAQAAGRVAVSRVHRYELYEEAFSPPFQPFTAVYGQLHRVLAISQHGAVHLRRYELPAGRVVLARLGVPPMPRAVASVDGVLRLVSCSTLTAVKRVPFTAQVLVAWAQRHSSQVVEWVHFGDGPERGAVESVLQAAPPNLRVRLAGRVDHGQVVQHYAQQPVDLFLLLSASEGLPVAIQEALGAGVPVLATDVGGVAEALAEEGDNGLLLPARAEPTEVLAALDHLLVQSTLAQREARREAAWRCWASRFDADCNHAELARLLHDNSPDHGSQSGHT